MSLPPLSPDDIIRQLGPPVRDTVFVDDHAFLLDRPSESDKRIEALGDYQPYWAELWPAARMLAKVIWREPWTRGTLALEIGCGLGLCGIVGLARGLNVIFSDYDPCALRFAESNARLNGFNDFQTMRIDWREPPSDRKASILFGADLVYEMSSVAPLSAFIKHMLAPDGVCCLTDTDRIPGQVLRDALASEGLRFEQSIVRAAEPNGRRLKGTLYRITLP